MRKLCIVQFILFIGIPWLPVLAQTPYLEVVDVPTDLPEGGTTFTPWQILLNSSGSYSVSAILPDGTPLDAVHRLPGGDWVLSIEGAVPPGSSSPPFDPRDLFRWDGASTYGYFAPFNGARQLIPPGSNVDAVLVDPTGAVVVSFDMPTEIGGIFYEPCDLVRYDQASSAFDTVPYFDASNAGLPCDPQSGCPNLIGADRRGLQLVFSLDVATDIPIASGSTTALPGELISWDGTSLSLFDTQPAWPENLSSQVNALTFESTAVGTTPDTVGSSLRLEAQDPSSLRLTWGASECSGGERAFLYQGTLGSFQSHVPVESPCEEYFLQATIQMPAEDAYFLVVPAGAAGSDEEGSYGIFHDQGGPAERPAALETCAQTQVLGCS